ncbi:MAG: DUF5808 domain-containing protein [Actinomycetota bacterium]
MERYGKFLGVPYDLRFPTPSRIRERMWNPGDPRVIVPRVFGAGWTVNFATLREKSTAGFYAALAAFALIYLNGLYKIYKKLAGLRKKD